MSGKWKSPLEDWENNNQDPNLAFTLVARNERAKQMWADPHNSSRYVAASFTREEPRDRSIRKPTPDLLGRENDGEQQRLKKKKETEPALRFLFNNWPKNFAKGFVLGSHDELCDALLGDPGDYISQQMLAFTFNKYHQLIMNVTSNNPTSVTFNNQKEAERKNFSWIFPRGQRLIHVEVADVLEFDVVLPKYGINKEQFHTNCESFLSSVACGEMLADGLDTNSIVATRQASGTSSLQGSFYLRGKVLGSGSYGDVYKVLRMPDGKTFAAKEFKVTDSLRQEVDMLKKVCKIPHRNIVQFVEEWHGDHKPLLIMECVAGGNLLQQMRPSMGFGKIANLANQTLAALVFLHDQGVMHRDIKPANILCVTADHYKLADFGVSKEVAPLLSKQGTEEYMAPEVHELQPYGYPADIWSLGVVLFQCMHDLPNGRPGPNGRKWCEEIFGDLTVYHFHYQNLPDMNGSDAFEVINLIKEAMIRMRPDHRFSARRCLEDYSYLWESLGHGDDSDAGSGANTPTQAHPNGSFPPNSLGISEDDEAAKDTSNTVRWNGEGKPEDGREPRNLHNEDRTTVADKDKAGTPFQGTISPWSPFTGGWKIHDPSSVIPSPPYINGRTVYDQGVVHPLYDPSHVFPSVQSTVGGTLYDPARAFPSVVSMPDLGSHTRSISDGSIKRRRDSNVSAEGDENDGSVTPGRRTPHPPGSEAATPGLDHGFEGSPSDAHGSSSTQNHKRSKSSA